MSPLVLTPYATPQQVRLAQRQRVQGGLPSQHPGPPNEGAACRWLREACQRRRNKAWQKALLLQAELNL